MTYDNENKFVPCTGGDEYGFDILKGSGRKAVALYAYAASKSDELTFAAGRSLTC